VEYLPAAQLTQLAEVGLLATVAYRPVEHKRQALAVDAE